MVYRLSEAVMDGKSVVGYITVYPDDPFASDKRHILSLENGGVNSCWLELLSPHFTVGLANSIYGKAILK